MSERTVNASLETAFQRFGVFVVLGAKQRVHVRFDQVVEHHVQRRRVNGRGVSGEQTRLFNHVERCASRGEVLTDGQQKKRSSYEQEEVPVNGSRSVPKHQDERDGRHDGEQEGLGVMAHRGLELIEQTVVSVEGLNRAVFIVGGFNALVERGQRNAHPVPVKTNGKNVAEDHNETQTHHER